MGKKYDIQHNWLIYWNVDCWIQCGMLVKMLTATTSIWLRNKNLELAFIFIVNCCCAIISVEFNTTQFFSSFLFCSWIFKQTHECVTFTIYNISYINSSFPIKEHHDFKDLIKKEQPKKKMKEKAQEQLHMNECEKR